MTEEKRQMASSSRPLYYKVFDEDTNTYIVGVDDGKGHWPLCSGVAEKHIEDLLSRLRAYPSEWASVGK